MKKVIVHERKDIDLLELRPAMTLEQWTDYHLSLIRDDELREQYRIKFQEKPNLYYTLFNGKRDGKLFLDIPIRPKTKKQFKLRYEFAPYCLGLCGRRIISFSPFGDVDPFYNICSTCYKRLKIQ